MAQGLVVFLVAFAMELAAAGWTLAVSRQRPLVAALASAACVYLSVFLVASWLEDVRLVHWMAGGHAAGVYGLLLLSRRRLKGDVPTP